MPFPDISPVAFTLFGFAVRWYALAYMSGFVISFYYMKYMLRRREDCAMTYPMLDDMVGYVVVGIILGGRLGYALFYNPEYYFSNPAEILMVWKGGMSFHGGLLGALSALAMWCGKNGREFFMVSDMACLCAPIGLFLGRLANFINGELYGRPTSSAIGVVFPDSDGLPRHPSQLYEAVLEGALLFALLHMFARFRGVRKRPGMVSFLFVGLYGVMRIAAEFFREPDAHIGFLPFGATMGQWLSLPIVGVAAVFVARLARRPTREGLFVASPMLGSLGFLTHRFFTRNGGVSSESFRSANCRFETSDDMANVRENRRRLMASVGVGAGKALITLCQKHTDKVVAIMGEPRTPDEYLAVEADALVTDRKDIAIGILTADCVPAIVADRRMRLVAAVHCGWKGIYGGVIGSTIAKMVSMGSRPGDLCVALGPCLKRASYEVDADFPAAILAQDESYGRFFGKGRKGKYLFDCSGYARAKFEAEGVRDIEVLDFDTCARDDLFFSYRRSVLSGDHGPGGDMDEGRQLSVVFIGD